MVAREAVQKAKNYILHLFKDEGIDRLGLEELEFRVEDAIWEVTIGFRRHWNSSPPPPQFILPSSPREDRIYKTVRIRDDDGRVIAVKHRDVSVPA